MFERFTPATRGSIVAAQERARELGAEKLGTEHLVLALAGVPGSTAAEALVAAGTDVSRLGLIVRDLAGTALDGEALASVGVDLDAVRGRADTVFGAGALDAVHARLRGHLPVTRRFRKVLEIALREAIALGHRRIDTGHVLLAVLRVADCRGRDALVRAGSDVELLRREVLTRLAADAA